MSDSWHKALVYFGLAEERDGYADADDDYPEPEPEAPGAPERAPSQLAPAPRRVRRHLRRRRAADAREPAPGRGRRAAKARNGSVKLHLVIPKSFNDAQQVADKFKDDIPVVLNLQSTDTDLSKRLIDFASGLTYALDGGMQRVADRVFMLTPRNVEISAEERAQLIEKGFFNQT